MLIYIWSITRALTRSMYSMSTVVHTLPRPNQTVRLDKYSFELRWSVRDCVRGKYWSCYKILVLWNPLCFRPNIDIGVHCTREDIYWSWNMKLFYYCWYYCLVISTLRCFIRTSYHPRIPIHPFIHTLIALRYCCIHLRWCILALFLTIFPLPICEI